MTESLGRLSSRSRLQRSLAESACPNLQASNAFEVEPRDARVPDDPSRRSLDDRVFGERQLPGQGDVEESVEALLMLPQEEALAKVVDLGGVFVLSGISDTFFQNLEPARHGIVCFLPTGVPSLEQLEHGRYPIKAARRAAARLSVGRLDSARARQVTNPSGRTRTTPVLETS